MERRIGSSLNHVKIEGVHIIRVQPFQKYRFNRTYYGVKGGQVLLWELPQGGLRTGAKMCVIRDPIIEVFVPFGDCCVLYNSDLRRVFVLVGV